MFKYAIISRLGCNNLSIIKRGPSSLLCWVNVKLIMDTCQICLWKKEEVNCFSKAESCWLFSKSIFVITSLIIQVIISRWIFNLHTRPLCANTLEKMANDLILHVRGNPKQCPSSITDWMKPMRERQDNKGRNLGRKITLLWILMDIFKKAKISRRGCLKCGDSKVIRNSLTCSYKEMKGIDVHTMCKKTH